MKNNVIVYGCADGIFKTAVKKLSEIILDYTLAHPACIPECAYETKENTRYFFIGTRENSHVLRKRPHAPLALSESYRIDVENDNVYIEGFDAAGALYGAIDFYGKYLVYAESTHASAPYLKNPFEGALADACFTGSPAVKQRGLWTWGHVIYDYRGCIDHMVQLKMNTLILWNDFAPLNAREILAYSHENNIRVFWGFPWGWDTDCAKIDIHNLHAYTENILSHYEQNYAPLGGDGIYFQTATELGTETLGGRVIAEAVTEFVNHTAGELYKKYPALEIQFGLHATSVKTKLSCIKNVDPRIRIVWENCGDFPFDYLPEKVDQFEETCAFVENILTLRKDKEKFGVVLKGLTKLDWTTFEHQKGPYVLGEASDALKENRVLRKQPIWRLLQAYWLKNGDKALEMMRLIQAGTNGNAVVTALIEDGMFEKNIRFPAALMGMMMWERDMDFRDMLCEAALQKHVIFA